MDIASLSAISGIENISKYADNSLQTEKSKGSGTASLTVCKFSDEFTATDGRIIPMQQK